MHPREPAAAQCVRLEDMIVSALSSAGFRDWHFHAASLVGVGICIGLWTHAKTVSDDERGNAERRALFIGLWPPTLWLIGDTLTE